jgi:hypothetical protein
VKDIYARCTELRRRSAAARVRAAAACEQWVCLQQRLKVQPAPAPVVGAAAENTLPTLTPTNAYDQAMETIYAMRAMLDDLPLEWQIAVVKTLTARTIVKARERAQPTRVLTA